MVVLEQDPLGQGGLSDFARRFRSGEISSEQATRAYLSRIEVLDPRLGAFQHVAAEQALETARAIDALYSAGTDLGPLMGVPLAVKDLFVVEGMPTTAGTKMNIDDIAGPEGPLVKSLRQAGCVILGKTKTVEFALGITGVSSAQGTPINPVQALQLLPAYVPSPSVRIRAVRSASLPRSMGYSGSRRHPVSSRPTEPSPWPLIWIRLAC
jgi:aspartyl-tRNA(Asn)/glutamyl-tRNA(Gln) amidotransferase subunit A